MSGVSDSGACAPRAARESDSEVVQTGSIFGYATEGATVADPRRSLSDEDVGQRFFEEAFRPQHEYPSPDAPIYSLDFPYPSLVLEPEVYPSTGDFSGGLDVDVAGGLDPRPEIGLASTTSPSQWTTDGEGNSGPSIDHGGDDSGLGPSLAPSTPLSAASQERRVVAQASPGLDPRLVGGPEDVPHTHDVAKEDPGLDLRHVGAQEDVPHAINRFPDKTSPYVHGNVGGRQQGLRDLVEDMAAVVDHGQAVPPKFPCTIGKCKKICKSKHGLSHHVRIHDKEWTHAHKCLQCEKGFRYLNNLTRHVEGVHDKVKVTCADCGKKFSRQDGLTRHRRSHTAASSSSTVSGQRSRRSAPANPRGPTQSRIQSEGSIQPSIRRARVNPETSG